MCPGRALRAQTPRGRLRTFPTTLTRLPSRWHVERWRECLDVLPESVRARPVQAGTCGHLQCGHSKMPV